MTRDKLTHLSVSELVDMILQQQNTIEWLQAHIAVACPACGIIRDTGAYVRGFQALRMSK